MNTQLLDIQPRELRFIFELKKQSSCTVRLVNKTSQHVAFKVKTTSPKKYCVRPNVGIVEPKESFEFVVIMQAPRSAPEDMICKDKFLIQSTMVRAGTLEEDITSDMFSKGDGRYVEEMKLKVILVSPAPSPDLTPINGTIKQAPTYESPIVKGQIFSKVENHHPEHEVDEHVEKSKIIDNEQPEPIKDTETESHKEAEISPVKPHKEAEVSPAKLSKEAEITPVEAVEPKTLKEVESGLTRDIETVTTKDDNIKNTKDIESRMTKEAEKQCLVKDIEEMKSKLYELESKLIKAEATISRLSEERKLTFQDREMLQQQLVTQRSRKTERRVQMGFPFTFVCMVALVSLVLGYCFRL